MEVLTFQFGHFSNFVGTHFWNIEDEVSWSEQKQEDDEDTTEGFDEPILDFNRLHFEVEEGRHKTWQPRAIIVDKKGALGAATTTERMSAEEVAHSVLWDQRVEQFGESPVEAHEFQKDLEQDDDEHQIQWGGDSTHHDEDEDYEVVPMETQPGPQEVADTAMKTSRDYKFSGTVRTWTDFLKIKLPAKSVHELQSCHHDVQPFNVFFDGFEVKRNDDEDSIIDIARRQMERCDQLDAYHSLIDSHDGMGGVASVVLQWAQEEQPKAGHLAMGFRPPSTPSSSSSAPPPMENGEAPGVASADPEIFSWLSSAFSLHHCLDIGVDCWIPCPVPIWSAQRPRPLRPLDPTCPYEVAALPALSMHVATAPYRLLGSMRPSAFLSALTPSSRPVSGLLLALPMAADQKALAGIQPDFFDISGMSRGLLNPYSSLSLYGAQPDLLFFDPIVSRKGRWEKEASQALKRGADEEVECVPAATLIHAAAGGSGKIESVSLMRKTLLHVKRHGIASTLCAKYAVEADDFNQVLEVISDVLESGAASDGDEDFEDDGY